MSILFNLTFTTPATMYERMTDYITISKVSVIFNPLHPNISMHILHTVLLTVPKMLIRRICFSIKSFFSWWSFPLFSWPSCLIQGLYCREKCKSRFTSILPCFRYSTPKFVQAITFYEQNIKLFEYFSNNYWVYWTGRKKDETNWILRHVAIIIIIVA